MYLRLCSKITIGNKSMKSVNDVVIRESIHELATSCVIKVPTSAVLKSVSVSQSQQPSVQTAAQFKRGDQVMVELGYNDELQREFVGFVTRINRTTPVEIECEGYSFLLRNKKNIKKSWKTTTLLEVLKEVVSGVKPEIKLHPDIPEIPLRNLAINNASGTQVIEYLKELLKGTITAFFIDDVLYVGLTYQDVTKQTVKYRHGVNVISDSLKYHAKDDVAVTIDFKHKAPDGSTKTPPETVGSDGGVTRTEIVSAVDDLTWLKKMAEAKLAQETFDGYEGSITAFLQPYCRAGYKAEYRNKRYPEKDGDYYVEGIQVTFGMGGARREPEFGLKLN